MALDILQHIRLSGPAFPEPFIRFQLEGELNKAKLLPKTTGESAKVLSSFWSSYRRKLSELVSTGGPTRVWNHVIYPLVNVLGYTSFEQSPEIETREGRENGGSLLKTIDGQMIRVWSVAFEEDLDAPSKRGRAYRYSHVRIAQRVLLAAGERIGLITNGIELRILISDPARPDSQIEIPVDPHWKRSRDVPDTFRLLLALASPKGVKLVPDLVEKARQQQTQVTKELRRQARQAVERFVQEVLDHPENQIFLTTIEDKQKLAKDLWHEGLITIYRLLFVLKLESSDDPAKCFSFASSSLWRNTFSPSLFLGRFSSEVLNKGANTGRLLEDGLRVLFQMFTEGLESTELNVKPLGGALFGREATPLLSRLQWGERGVAHLLDSLLLTPVGKGASSRERVHYGSLDVEDLGRVYEALLELEPGIATETVCRLRRSKLEVVVPAAQGEKYKPVHESASGDAENVDDEESDEDEADAETDGGKKTKILWIEEIPSGRFYLRVGLGRKASGSYYTPHSFVRFLVQETLGPQVAERSPKNNPMPAEILKIKVLDPAMGSGHFLVEACRFLGDKLYEACRLCDELATDAENAGKKAEAESYLQRVLDLPDPDNELLRYLPSHAPEGIESGYSQKRAEALCKRLVAVHCIYGVDKNPLAVELAKLSIWLEVHAEGMPLTFIDHRLVLGDSLPSPFISHLSMRPCAATPIEDLFATGLTDKLGETLRNALGEVHRLESSVGVSISETESKITAKREMDERLAPLRVTAAAWAGAVMLATDDADDAYVEVLKSAIERETNNSVLLLSSDAVNIIRKGLNLSDADVPLVNLLDPQDRNFAVPALSYEFEFPEVFYPTGDLASRRGFDAIVGNPPWDRQEVSEIEFWATYDLRPLEAPSKRERDIVVRELMNNSQRASLWSKYVESTNQEARYTRALYQYQSLEVDGAHTVGRPDIFKLFAERFAKLIDANGKIGVLVPSAFHANEGTAGIRKLYLESLSLSTCYSYENKQKLFEIHPSFKFALIVAQKRDSPTVYNFSAAFYQHSDTWLFGSRDNALEYTTDFVRTTGGKYLTFVECRSQVEADTTYSIFKRSKRSLNEFLSNQNVQITIGLEMHRTQNTVFSIGTDLNTPAALQMGEQSSWSRIPIAEGKIFHQYTDCWAPLIRDYAEKTKILQKAHWKKSLPFFRLGIRCIASSTNERTIISTVLPPMLVVNHSVLIETSPAEREVWTPLALLTVLNSFTFDWLARSRVAATVSRFMIAPIPIPELIGIEQFLTHAALRLVCNHAGYSELWEQQLGDIWRETGSAFEWPAVGDASERNTVRSAVDAVIAHQYGLSRSQYEYLLSTFNHSANPEMPKKCLSNYDEYLIIKKVAYLTKHDRYSDIPLKREQSIPAVDLMTSPANGNPAQTSFA